MAKPVTKTDDAPEEGQEMMVLRTVYLPASLDDELKKLAFYGSTSKGALIRKALKKLVADSARTKVATKATQADARADED